MDIETRLNKSSEQGAICHERWLEQREKNLTCNERLKSMSLRLNLLELWRSKLAGQITIVVAIVGFLGAVFGSVVAQVMVN